MFKFMIVLFACIAAAQCYLIRAAFEPTIIPVTRAVEGVVDGPELTRPRLAPTGELSPADTLKADHVVEHIEHPIYGEKMIVTKHAIPSYDVHYPVVGGLLDYPRAYYYNHLYL